MVLFLDFDGVMHPYGCDTSMLFCRRELFECFMERRPEIKIVISSAWRKEESLTELQAYFSKGFESRIVGKTGVDGQNSLGRRQRECVAWLKENGLSGERWVAVDDDAAGFKNLPRTGSVLFIDPTEGLSVRALDLLARMIDERKSPVMYAYELHQETK